MQYMYPDTVWTPAAEASALLNSLRPCSNVALVHFLHTMGQHFHLGTREEGSFSPVNAENIRHQQYKGQNTPIFVTYTP